MHKRFCHNMAINFNLKIDNYCTIVYILTHMTVHIEDYIIANHTPAFKLARGQWARNTSLYSWPVARGWTHKKLFCDFRLTNQIGHRSFSILKSQSNLKNINKNMLYWHVHEQNVTHKQLWCTFTEKYYITAYNAML